MKKNCLTSFVPLGAFACLMTGSFHVTEAKAGILTDRLAKPNVLFIVRNNRQKFSLETIDTCTTDICRSRGQRMRTLFAARRIA